jgi:adenylate kinase family enzyme
MEVGAIPGSEDLQRRISIVGCSGAGKTTLAKALAARYGLPHVELDALYHLENWTPQERSVFQEQTRAATPSDGRWVVCGNYNDTVGDDLRSRANHVIFLDLPKRIVMARILRRSLARVATGQALWNGNRERWRNLIHPIPEENIVLWAWTRWGRYRKGYRSKMARGDWNHARVDHLQSPTQVQEFLAQPSHPLDS